MLWIARVTGLLSLALLIFQHRLIYLPRKYSKELIAATPAKPLHYRTEQGDQVAWLIHEDSTDAKIVWLVTCGNGTCALDLVNYFDSMKAMSHDVFVLVDYPSYGISEGRPSPASIRESLNALVPALTQRLRQSASELTPKLRVWGHSLGSAAALMAMDDLGIQRGVLIAPFRTMRDMAQLTVGWPLCYLLHHRFNNVLSLQRLHARRGCHLEVLHGSLDEVIPPSQGRELAEAFPDLIHFEFVEGAYHNLILDSHSANIIAAMLRARQ